MKKWMKIILGMGKGDSLGWDFIRLSKKIEVYFFAESKNCLINYKYKTIQNV